MSTVLTKPVRVIKELSEIERLEREARRALDIADAQHQRVSAALAARMREIWGATSTPNFVVTPEAPSA